MGHYFAFCLPYQMVTTSYFKLGVVVNHLPPVYQLHTCQKEQKKLTIWASKTS
jgi:hypothetical protein